MERTSGAPLTQGSAATERDADELSLSVVVPTYNEADNVEACLESVFRACASTDAVETYEVILVDSNSTDATVELATDYPVTVLRIPDDDLCTPAAGRYVGTHHADGDALLFVDGDMEVAADWLPDAAAHLREEDVAAVDGHLDEVPEDAALEERESVRGVALYDADALADVGGFDPYLESVEDVQLGLELNAAGYRLLRVPTVSAHHPGSDVITETVRRWRNGYSRGNGQAIRRSLSSPRLVAKHVYRMRFRLVIGGWLGLGALSLATGVGVLPWLLGSALGFRKIASERDGVVDAAGYVLYKLTLLVGLVLGLLERPTPPEQFPLERVERVAEAGVHRGTPSNLQF